MSVSNQILEIIEQAKEEAKSAECDFDLSAEMIGIKSSTTIDLYSDNAVSKVADIAAMSREACDKLYATYQMLVTKIDAECRPLLASNPDVDAVCAVTETIKWLNSESSIQNNFSGSINGGSQKDLVGVRYIASIESKMIESFWESKLNEMPGSFAAQKAYRQKLRDAERAEKEAEKKRAQELEEYEKQKEAAERQAKLDRFAKNASAVEARREHLRVAQTMFHCGPVSSVYITTDGKAHVEYNGQYDFGHYERYRSIVESISDFKSAVCTYSAFVGLHKNGTCFVAHGKEPIDYKNDPYANVRSWTNIKKLAAGFDHVVGLRHNGTCVCSKLRATNSCGSFDVSVADWTDIEDIACGRDFIIGLKKDGTVVHAGSGSNGAVRDDNMKIVKWLPTVYDCEKWKDVALIGAGSKNVYGVTKTGEILCVGERELSKKEARAENVVQITVADGKPFFLQANGKVIGDFNSSGAQNAVAISGGYVLLVLHENGKIDAHKISHKSFSGSCSIKLFDNYNDYVEEVKKAEEAEVARRVQQNKWIMSGVCQHCGGTFKKSLFSSKCIACGKKKDYK